MYVGQQEGAIKRSMMEVCTTHPNTIDHFCKRKCSCGQNNAKGDKYSDANNDGGIFNMKISIGGRGGGTARAMRDDIVMEVPLPVAE